MTEYGINTVRIDIAKQSLELGTSHGEFIIDQKRAQRRSDKPWAIPVMIQIARIQARYDKTFQGLSDEDISDSPEMTADDYRRRLKDSFTRIVGEGRALVVRRKGKNKEVDGQTSQKLLKALFRRSDPDSTGVRYYRLGSETTRIRFVDSRVASKTLDEPKSVHDALGAVPMAKSWFVGANRTRARDLWLDQESLNERLYRAIVNYYEQRDVECHSFPGSDGRTKVPLYVAPGWDSVDDSSLVPMGHVWKLKPYEETNIQAAFWDFYFKKVKNGDHSSWWDGDMWQLQKIAELDNVVQLQFQRGKFHSTFVCQYLLEHESLWDFTQGHGSEEPNLPLRDQVAGSEGAVVSFCEQNPVRVGISNLLLLKKNSQSYIPVIFQRADQSVARGIEPATSGFYDIIATKSVDGVERDWWHKVLEEIYEELYEEKEKRLSVVRQHSNDAKYFYKEKGIKELLNLEDDGLVAHEVTGFGIDLIRIVPEICMVTVVQDEKYYKLYTKLLATGPEHRPLPERWSIPIELDDVDEFMSSQMFRSPTESTIGFDPYLWTLPGALCFHQGIRRVIEKGLLV